MKLSHSLLTPVLLTALFTWADLAWSGETQVVQPISYAQIEPAPVPADDFEPPAVEPDEQTEAPEPGPATGSPCCGQAQCDCAKKKALAKAAAGAYKGLYYNNDFSYLTDPCYNDSHLGESLKRQPLGRFTTIDIGGEYRLRYHSEHNLRTKPLTGNDDDFLLQRTRLYLNAQVGDRFRFYGEAIDATSWGQNFTPRAIEVNRIDALNLFGDLNLLNDIWSSGDALSVRGGRQELSYGAQRTVSPLDWSNTRRTFDGVKMYYQSKKWDVDAWWTRPVPFGQHVQNGLQDHNFDHSNEQQDFVGLWSTYKSAPGRVADFYFLRLDDYSGLLGNSNGNAGDADFNLLGLRLMGDRQGWLYELEGGYQFGEFGPDDIDAGYVTIGGGRQAKSLPGSPTLWAYYDWASGDNDPNDATHGTFNQYFPLGHKYLGLMDIVGRQNIQDVNLLATVTPHEKAKLLVWYHVFHLEQARDALYNAAGNAIYQDPTGLSGTDVGQELDLVLQWTLTPRSNVLFGYSHFWGGDYFDSPTIQTAGVPAGGRATNGSDGKDADFFYSQFTVRF